MEKRATAARQNQQFNSDDLIELMKKEIIGEASDGTVAVVPKSSSTRKRANSDLELANMIILEENRDRAVIWQRVIEKSPDLQTKDLTMVKDNYHQQMFEKMEAGMWYQDAKGQWVKKQK
jgi:uncharacterized protein YdbL (DUF1318 family)